MNEKWLLTDAELNACVANKQQLKDYLAEPDDEVAASLPPLEKTLVAKAILLARNVAKAQLDKAEPLIRQEERGRVMSIIEKEYPAVTAWTFWKALKATEGKKPMFSFGTGSP